MKQTPEQQRENDRRFRALLAADVRWYRQYGQYPEQRIRLSGFRAEYVIGDWSWHRAGRPVEMVDKLLPSAFSEGC